MNYIQIPHNCHSIETSHHLLPEQTYVTHNNS